MRDFLGGGAPGPDTAEYHGRWGYMARLFFMGINRENGTLQHLPYPGSLLQQPAKTLSVFEVMQGCFMEHVNRLARERR